ncbi:MAG: hypothetical protein A3K19_29780 [Lentisphaerae bacterium RIFOXYB12_FULL_65_16]|nr:MAG: hypothetical protein A3K18_33390 [Lentisphaerae bacterium RIFOXYA12_64_32]OGV86519.1 MAG: hypothetical protein A3K19_29780 [Lentisphaerae bacterium RIFOXYB12_FULL_65_16]
MFIVDQKLRRRHLEFIQANWRQLARAAYRGHRAKGRGMLFIREIDFISLPPGVLCRFRCTYVAEGSPESEALGKAWPGEKEAGWVKSYNPDTHALVCFVREDDSSSSYSIGGIPGWTPRQCSDREDPPPGIQGG